MNLPEKAAQATVSRRQDGSDERHSEAVAVRNSAMCIAIVNLFGTGRPRSPVAASYLSHYRELIGERIFVALRISNKNNHPFGIQFLPRIGIAQ
ncbi:hypothetical protein [Paraburkholderia sp. ZP32-5]|uniref:hypothetical protein n=1 Tax=Paraburkholderia sp. ZP32-5 TaxID=2883245 RepID=UPI001F1F4B7F|nr:hypothetical protein [Paraburkholderia sp. ZP32-5]